MLRLWRRKTPKSAPLLILDPELNVTFQGGHNWSFFSELEQISRENGFEVAFYGNKWSPAVPAGINSILPFFETGYYLHESQVRKCLEFTSEIIACYEQLRVPPGSRILMHGAAPWHLEGIANLLEKRNDVRIAVGLLIPLKFWAKDEALLRAIDERLNTSLALLKRLNAFIYTETGEYHLLGRSVHFPVLLPPISQRTRDVAARFRLSREITPNRPIRFGYFGLPKPCKGFNLLCNYLNNESPKDAMEVHFFLPEQPWLKEFDANINRARVHINKTTNIEMLRDMASVDVVICFYDPCVYDQRMSGIVAEALLLGKPLLLTRGTSLERFVNDVAPRSAIVVDYSLASLTSALDLPAEAWVSAGRHARKAVSIVSELKSGQRYLETVFGLSADDKVFDVDTRLIT
jgi:hypothetical protein